MGWQLGKRSLWVVWNDKTLLAFPLLTIVCYAFTVLMFHLSVGPDKLQFFINTLRNEAGVQNINWDYYFAVLIAYLILAVISTFFNVALVGCTHITLGERDSKFGDGFSVAFKHIGSIFAWAMISATVGLLFNLLDRERHSAGLLRKILGMAWSVMTYFVAPIMVVENTNIFQALRHSPKIMRDTWGENLGAQFSFFWFNVLLNVPLLIVALLLFAFGFTLNSFWMLLGLSYFLLTVVVSQTAKSVLTVVLYKYAADNAVPNGFEDAPLEAAFVAMGKVLKLRDEAEEKAVAEVLQEDAKGR